MQPRRMCQNTLDPGCLARVKEVRRSSGTCVQVLAVRGQHVDPCAGLRVGGDIDGVPGGKVCRQCRWGPLQDTVQQADGDDGAPVPGR